MRWLASVAVLCCVGCATTLDHQAEMLLHEHPLVQVPALAGAAPGALLGSPLWATAALLFGPEAPAPGFLLHAFAYPGELLLAGIPWLIF